MHKNIALALENITRLEVVSNRSNIDSRIMIHLESMVRTSNQEHPFTYLSLREVQCFVHHSLARSSVIPIRSSTRRRKFVNPTLVHATLPVAKPTPPLANSDIIGDQEGVDGKNVDHFHIEDLSKVHSDDDDGEEEEILPKIIEPFSLDYLLNNPLPREESFGATICNFAESLVTTFLTPSQLKPSLDPREVFSGLFAPVCETDPTDCNIIRGHLPKDLNGAYLRNGPNASLLHRGEGFHLFDGDGMIHSIMMRNGSASFCSRFVRTSRFRQEQAAGRPLFLKFFGGMNGPSGVARVLISGLRATFGLVDLTRGVGLSNTNVAFFNGHVLSLSEEDMPYIVKITEDGDIVTLRQFKLPSKSNMCAHPKFDPISGEMYAFSLNLPFFPPFSVFRVSADGVKSADIPVPLLDVPLVHDFALTRRFIIFPDNQLAMRPTELAKGEMPLACDLNKTPRFCLLPRYALPEESASKAQWFETPGVNCLHYVNAWEEGADEVVLITSVLSPVEKMLQIPANCSSTLSEVRFNTRTGGVEQRVICSGIELELGVINQKYTGRKMRYAYFAKGGFPYINGVVKVDLMQPGGSKQECIVGKRDFGEGRYGGEPFFVEARGAKSEDHGYLLCLVGDEKGGVSELLVMDTLSPSLEVICAIELPVRVPAGFHGCFVNQEQLAQQKP